MQKNITAFVYKYYIFYNFKNLVLRIFGLFLVSLLSDYVHTTLFSLRIWQYRLAFWICIPIYNSFYLFCSGSIDYINNSIQVTNLMELYIYESIDKFLYFCFVFNRICFEIWRKWILQRKYFLDLFEVFIISYNNAHNLLYSTKMDCTEIQP